MFAAATAPAAALLASPAAARTVRHVAPEGGAGRPRPGRKPRAPLATVHAALRTPSVKAGDTVLPLDGNHGTLPSRHVVIAGNAAMDMRPDRRAAPAPRDTRAGPQPTRIRRRLPPAAASR
jgi:hypothetical protein